MSGGPGPSGRLSGGPGPSGGDFLPFTAVVGQDEAKLALLLAASEARIGGVLLRGDKGSGKTTLARGLAALLPGDAPFVELPIGATEDRVVGTLDLAVALTGGEKRFDPGLLHAADGGVLYVDEINLLPDHLVDVLLDVAASGVNRIEREGVSHAHSSRFLLIGSMNPEEGDLRPQLLDRFGLAVQVRTAAAGNERLSALRRRLEFDTDPDGVRERFADREGVVRDRLARSGPARIPRRMLEAVASLCASVGAEGLRADLTICRAAAALAGWEGRKMVSGRDIRRVAPLALVHRARRDPLDQPGADRERVEKAVEQFGSDEQVAIPEEMEVAPLPKAPRKRADAATGRRAPAPAPRGRVVGEKAPDGPVRSVAVGATVRKAAARRRSDPDGPLVAPSDVRQAVKEHRQANLIVIAVDASRSMGTAQRMEAAKGVVLALLRDAYQRRDLVSLVTFSGEAANVVLRPTSSVEVAKARMVELPSGGRTPLAAGLSAALGVATSRSGNGDHEPLLVVITDGRATFGPPDPLEAARLAAEEVRRSGIRSLVIDVEGHNGLGLALKLAEDMGGDHVRARELSPAAMELAIRRAAIVR